MPAKLVLGAVSMDQGRMNEGLKMIEDGRRLLRENGNKIWLIRSEIILGMIYRQIAEGGKPVKPSTLARNIGFVVKNVPFAAKKAEDHFKKSIEMSKEVGANGLLGQAYLELGLLHKKKGRMDPARECFTEAARIFEECGAEGFLQQAKTALTQVGVGLY